MKLCFKNYIHLTQAQSKAILDLRNLDYIRLNMQNSTPIAWENHLQWIQTLHDNLHKEYFALILNDTVVGSCSWVKNEENIPLWGIFFVQTINPIISSLSAYLFISYLLEDKQEETIYSYVRKSNPLALKFNQHLGFSINKDDDEFHYLSLTKKQWQEKTHSRFITSLKKYLGKIKYEFQ